MTNKITCQTLFDITATGVRSYYRASLIPFKDETGKIITDTRSWDRARNQQRNWETLNQIISLRVLPEEITHPIQKINNDKQIWEFEFVVPSLETVTMGNNPVGALMHDCQSVPMILNLDETAQLETVLKPSGEDVNIWFWVSTAK
jgi:hypothetical protein